MFNASQSQCISPTQKRMTANKIPKPVKVVNILFTCELLLDYNEQQDRLMSAPLHSSVDGVFFKTVYRRLKTLLLPAALLFFEEQD